MEAGKPRSTPEQPRTAEVRAFLICDIRGYSTFTSQRGDEAAARLARTFAGLARDAVVARGGRVIELRGDEVFAAFTAARQAVKAGLEIYLACAEESAAHPDFPIPVGIGIDFGEAVPVEDGYRGAAINMSARLCSKAVAGQVLVTRNVVDAAGELEGMSFENLGTVVVKGFDEPVAIYEPVATALRDQREAGREGRASDGARGFLPIELDEPLPVVGRDAEMAWLRGTWRQARRGYGRVVLVTGPAGIGKTRLAAWFASAVYADGGSVRYAGAGGAAGAETLAAIREACATSLPGLWVLDDLDIYRESVASLAASLHEIESGPALVLGLLGEAGSDPAVVRLVGAVDVHGDGRRELAPVDEQDVRAIARSYGIDVADLPAEQILRASGGVPSRVHELVADWSRDEAARRLAAAAEWLAAGRSRQAEGLRFADNVIALKLRRIYDRATREQLAGVCPYKGLGTFEQSDAAYFFGREQLVGELAARSVGFGLLGVVGPSGSGKSSLVLAGLLPSLAAGLLPGSDRWGHAVLRPGARPMAELDNALSGADRAERLVLVVDQFEEVFTTTAEPPEQEAFIGRLVELASDPAVAVVVTIRADYTGQCAPYPEFAELLAANLVLVGPLTADQLRRAIELPARRVGLRVESALVDALVTEVKDEPGGLPLLSTALVQLWQARSDGWLRYEAYLRGGGVRSAVARLAESSYEQLSDSERESAMSVFVRLVGQGEGDAAVRRRVPLSEFDVDRDPTVASVLSALTRDRLLTQDEGLVEIAHEALIREWPRFAGWLRDDAAGQELRSHLTQAARQWSERGRDPGDLYRGARLSAALDWSQRHDRALNALERDFLSESRVASERQLERQRRTNRRLRGLLSGTAVLLALALIAGLFALLQRNHARAAQHSAEAAALKSDAERVGTLAQTERNLDLSMLLAVAGVKLDNIPQTRSDLLAALERSPAAIRVVHPSTGEISGVAISPDGRLMVTGDSDGAVRFEDLRAWTPSGGAVQLPSPVLPNAVRFSPDGRTVAVASGAGTLTKIYLIDVASRTKRLLGSFSGAVPPIPFGSTTVAFSPNNAEIAVGLADWPIATALTPVSERVALLQASTGRVLWIRSYHLHPGQSALQLGFTPAGVLVTSAEQGSTDMWDTRAGRIERSFPDGGRFALSPNGNLAAIALNNPSLVQQTPTAVVLLDLSTGAVHQLQSLPDPAWIVTLAFTPDGKSLVAGSQDGDVRVWDLASGTIAETLTSQSGGQLQVAVDPSGRTVVSGTDNGTVIAWDLSGQQSLGRTFAWNTPANSCPGAPCMAINPAGTIMATDEGDGTVDLVDLRTLRWFATLPATDGQVANGLAFTPDGRQLLTGDTGGHIVFWDTRTWAAVRRLRVSRPIVYLAVSPDGTLLAVETQQANATSAQVQILDVATGGTERTFNLALASTDIFTTGIAFSHDGTELAACCTSPSTVEVMNVASGRQLFTAHIAGEAHSLAYSPTAPELAIGSSNGRIYLWNTQRRTQTAAITAAASNVVSVAYSTDGKLLAASFRDGTSVLLDRATGQTLGQPFPAEPAAIPTVLFSSNRQLVINYVGTATIWPTGLAALQRFACQVAGRDITPAEWSSVLPGRPYQHLCPTLSSTASP
jgi:WD40 repeat protein/class 3 adenylate cyclase